MIKRGINNKLFLLCVILFVAHQILQLVLDIAVPFLDSYLDPLLIMPILLHLMTLERRMLAKNPTYVLPLNHIAGMTILIVIVAEIIFPLLYSRHTADLWDVPFYALGSLVYIYFQRQSS